MPASAPIRNGRPRSADLPDHVLRVSGSDHAAALFNLERAGHIYTRISNPTTAVLEERVSVALAGVGAICTASGMAAMHLAIATSSTPAIISSPPPRSMAAPSTCWRTPCPASASRRRSSSRVRWTNSGRRSSEHAACDRRDHRQSRPRSAGYSGVAQIAHDARIPLLDRQHLCDAIPQPADRTRRRYRHELRDQTARRPRHRNRRGDRRRRKVRLARFRQIRGADRTLTPAITALSSTSNSDRPPSSCAPAPRGCAISAPRLSPTNAFQLLQGIETLACAWNGT